MNDKTMKEMMEQYSVRAKRKDNGQWVEGFLYPLAYDGESFHYDAQEYSWCISVNPLVPNTYGEIYDEGSDWFVIDEKTICHYTGLTDKNGQKIWENDIVKKHFYTDYDVFDNSEFVQSKEEEKDER